MLSGEVCDMKGTGYREKGSRLAHLLPFHSGININIVKSCYSVVLKVLPLVLCGAKSRTLLNDSTNFQHSAIVTKY